jgi:hypothetical protein
MAKRRKKKLARNPRPFKGRVLSILLLGFVGYKAWKMYQASKSITGITVDQMDPGQIPNIIDISTVA